MNEMGRRRKTEKRRKGKKEKVKEDVRKEKSKRGSASHRELTTSQFWQHCIGG